MSETKERTCAERIQENLNYLREELKTLYEREDEGAFEELCEMAYGVETHYETVVTLSGGGPADYLEITHDGRDVFTVTYRFSDWFDTATVSVDRSDENIWAYAQHIIEGI